MSNVSTDAGKWMRENGFKWKPTGNAPKGKRAKYASTKIKRIRRARNLGVAVDGILTVKAFVEAHRGTKDKDCIFVPGAQKNVPASVEFLGKEISAARYMLLLSAGAPKSEGMLVRHLCGCGHLSCVNPNHLVWGTPGDNVADANKHQKAGANVQDRINAID